jgi:hypothetical protein
MIPKNFQAFVFLKEIIEPYSNKYDAYPDLVRNCIHFDESSGD